MERGSGSRCHRIKQRNLSLFFYFAAIIFAKAGKTMYNGKSYARIKDGQKQKFRFLVIVV